jgi:hypothetical protein
MVIRRSVRSKSDDGSPCRAPPERRGGDSLGRGDLHEERPEEPHRLVLVRSGRLDAALGHYESAREAAGRLGSKSWMEETGAAADKIRKRLREAGVAREGEAGAEAPPKSGG